MLRNLIIAATVLNRQSSNLLLVKMASEKNPRRHPELGSDEGTLHDSEPSQPAGQPVTMDINELFELMDRHEQHRMNREAQLEQQKREYEDRIYQEERDEEHCRGEARERRLEDLIERTNIIPSRRMDESSYIIHLSMECGSGKVERFRCLEPQEDVETYLYLLRHT